jgi:hypothetical protein
MKKSDQQLMPLFDGKFVENKPIPFPSMGKSTAYSNLFYWAHLEANETAEFPLHSHEGFEIMTFVFKGSLEHFDTATNVWTPLNAGGVQVIQAGSGVSHSERIKKGTELFQIWFDPDFSKSLKENARYKDYSSDLFKVSKKDGIRGLKYVGKDSLITSVSEGLEIEKMEFENGNYNLKADATCSYSFYLLNGSLKLNNQNMNKDDFLLLKDENNLMISAQEGAELFMIKSPTHVEYKRYID